jgi:hypothetical protein
MTGRTLTWRVLMMCSSPGVKTAVARNLQVFEDGVNGVTETLCRR